MTDLLIYIVKQLVNNPDVVSVEEVKDEGQLNLLLTVDPSDMGIVIGKNGQTIKAIRRVLSIRAMTENIRVNVQLVEPEGSERNKVTEEETVTGSENEEKPGESSKEAEVVADEVKE